MQQDKLAERLFRPICLMQPERLAPGARVEHLPFAFCIIDAVRPEVLVELGTHYGTSYCGFLQAVKQLGLAPRCSGVDTWQGDPHSGLSGEEVYAELAAYHGPRFGAFSSLIRSTFDEAVRDFAASSIDLLHIDGYRTYDAVKHDFETWLPKLSRRGVVLFADTDVRERDLGEWRLWEELSSRYPAFRFQHQHGLGVLAVGEDMPGSIRWLTELAAGRQQLAAYVRRYFAGLGAGIRERHAAEQPRAAPAARAELTPATDEFVWRRQALEDAQHKPGAPPQSVIVLTGRFAYNSLDAMLRLLARHWAVPVVEVDLSAADWQNQLQRALNSTRVRFVVSLTGVGLHLVSNGTNLWQQLRIPVFCLHFDHPAYFGTRHQNLPANVMLGYMHRDHAIFQREFVKAPNLVTSIDFGIPDPPPGPFPAARSNEPKVVFAKTGNDPRELEAHWQAKPVLARLIHDVLDEVGLDSCGAYPAAIQKVTAAHRLEIQPFDKLSRFLIAQVDDYLRRRKSTWIATALKPFPVDVYGSRWDHVSGDSGRARFHGAIDYAEFERETAGAVASITMNPNIAMGAHDRFFTALGAGVMPVSDRNPFIAAKFPTLLPFTFAFEDGALEAVLEEIFTHPRETLEAARAARAAAMPQLSTRETARNIESCVDLLEYFEFSFESPQDFFFL